MATLLRQKAASTIGPIGIVTPTSLLAKAQAAEASVQAIDQIRARYTADLYSQRDDQDRAEFDETLLRVSERWTEEFYYQREKGEEGLANFDEFMANHMEAVLGGVNPRIQDDLRTALTRMRLSESGSLREEQYQEMLAYEQKQREFTVNSAVIGLGLQADTLAFNARGDIGAFDAGFNAAVETARETIPEEDLPDFDLRVAQIYGQNRLAIAHEARTQFEKASLEMHNAAMDTSRSHITWAIDNGASDAEILGAVQAMRNLAINSGEYATTVGAELAVKRQLYDIQAQILARDVIALKDQGLFAEADALLASFRTNGDHGVLMVDSFASGFDLTQIVGIAQGNINTHDYETGPTAVENNEAFDNHSRWEKLVEESSMTIMPAELEDQIFSTNEETQHRLMAAMRAELEKNQALGRAARAAGTGELASLNALMDLPTEDRRDAVEIFASYKGWSVSNFYADMSLFEDAKKFYETTRQMPDAVKQFIASAGLASDAAPMAVAVAARFVADVKDNPNLKLSDIPADQLDIYESVLETVGKNATDQMLFDTYKAVEAAYDPTLSAQRAMAEYEALLNNPDPTAIENFANDIYHNEGDQSSLMNQFMRAFNNDFVNSFGVTVSTGESTPATDIRVLEGLPASYYPAADGIIGWLENAIGSSWHNTAGVAQGGLAIATLNPALLADIKTHDTFKEDIPLFPVGSEAFKIFDAAVRNNILTKNLSMRGAFIQALETVHSEGFGLSMFAEESVRIESSLFDVMGRDIAYTKHPFENYVDGNLGLAMQELLVGATRWARSDAAREINFHLADVDMGDHLDQGRITVEAVENFDPNNPKFQVFLYPLDAQVSTGKIPLFIGGDGDGTWSYSGQSDINNTKDSIDFMREAGIESDFIASIGGVLLEHLYERQLEGSRGQFGEALITGDTPDPLDLPQLEEYNYDERIVPPVQ